MRVFVAGATGAIGRQLVPMLVAQGHEVVGTTRWAARAADLRAAGAEPAVVDALDAEALMRVVVEARPEVVIHELTDLTNPNGPGIADEQLVSTARLRREATANLVRASLAAGARRLVAQSAAWLYAPGPEAHAEGDPLGASGGWQAIVLPGIVTLERLVLGTSGLDGLALRYGFFYGPGTGSDGPSEPPTVDVRDAADATLLAIDRGLPGAYNIVDDGGPISNARARVELGWSPRSRARGQESRD